MKSVIIKQNGKKIIHIKQTKDGADADILEELKDIEIVCVMDNNEIIKLGKPA